MAIAEEYQLRSEQHNLANANNSLASARNWLSSTQIRIAEAQSKRDRYWRRKSSVECVLRNFRSFDSRHVNPMRNGEMALVSSISSGVAGYAKAGSLESLICAWYEHCVDDDSVGSGIVGSLNAEISRCQAEIDQANRELVAAEAERNEAQSQVGILQAQIDSISRRISGLQNSIREYYENAC